MSTTFIMGLVGVSIHTNYTKKDRVSYYGNAGVEYTFLAPGQKSISESTQSALNTCANNKPLTYFGVWFQGSLELVWFGTVSKRHLQPQIYGNSLEVAVCAL